MTTESSEDDFKVGYKCPPQHSRFQPGSSGNPAGKQKAVRNLGSDVKRIADVVVRLGLTQSDIGRIDQYWGRYRIFQDTGAIPLECLIPPRERGRKAMGLCYIEN
jgi:hypothetical protein